MRVYPSFVNASTVVAVLQQILSLRKEDITTVESLSSSKLKGRDRTGVRVVPSSNSDVAADDVVGDRLNDATYRYVLVDVGSPKWDRQTLDVSW